MIARRDCLRGLLHRGKTSFGMLKLMRRICRARPVLPPRSAFTGFRFPREVIVLAVRWYLRYGLSYRDVEELMAERGVLVDHVTIHPVGPAVHPDPGRDCPLYPARDRVPMASR